MEYQDNLKNKQNRGQRNQSMNSKNDSDRSVQVNLAARLQQPIRNIELEMSTKLRKIRDDFFVLQNNKIRQLASNKVNNESGSIDVVINNL